MSWRRKDFRAGRARPYLTTVGMLAVFALISCGVGSSNVASVGLNPRNWRDQPVTFTAGKIKVYGTFRGPIGGATRVPGVLLLAGSGPTDRNGNDPLAPGKIDTLKTLADWLSADGVASLRYDKLGSGKTGFGYYGGDPGSVGMKPYQVESVDALKFLAEQKSVDDKRIAVFGHSEGALFALLLAAGKDGEVPPIRALGLFEPLSVRYLDLFKTQADKRISEEEHLGYFTASAAGNAEMAVANSVKRMRESGKAPLNLPLGFSQVLDASRSLFFYQADKFDPGSLAQLVKPGTPVLVTCSNSDILVSCSEVQRVVSGLTVAKANVDFLHLRGVDHVLKVDPSGKISNFSQPLPFSPTIRKALASFVQKNLY